MCKVECDPVCAVSWFRNGVPIEFDERSSNNSSSADIVGPHHYVVKSHAEVQRSQRIAEPSEEIRVQLVTVITMAYHFD